MDLFADLPKGLRDATGPPNLTAEQRADYEESIRVTREQMDEMRDVVLRAQREYTLWLADAVQDRVLEDR